MNQHFDWGGWLRHTTGAQSTRDIAIRCNVSHTTVQRWIRSGIPPDVVFRIGIAFRADLYQTVIDMGWVSGDDLIGADWSKILPHIPYTALTEEVHRRATDALASAGEGMLRREDIIPRQSFRLTSKQS